MKVKCPLCSTEQDSSTLNQHYTNCQGSQADARRRLLPAESEMAKAAVKTTGFVPQILSK